MSEEYEVKNTNTFINIAGQTFNELTAIRYLGNRMWEWRCSCDENKIVVKRKNDVMNGRVKSCGHLANRGTPNTVNVGDKFNEWTVIEVISKSKLRCKCSCNKERIVNSYDLKNGKSKSCGHLTKGDGENGKIDLTGKTFGEWKVLRYDTTPKKYGFWICECSCGKEKSVRGITLRNGESKSCGHDTNEFKDLTGMQFNEWTALKFKGDYKWECKCSCGKIKIVGTYDLKEGKSTNCGHLRTPHKLIGKRFDKLVVTKYIRKGFWECKCDCGNITKSGEYSLINKSRKSCSCLAQDKKQAIIDSVEYVISTFIDTEGELPFIEDIAEATNLTPTTVRKYINELGLNDYINKSFGSKPERDLYDLIAEFTDSTELHNRTILNGKELDLYIPSHKLAIEFNGSYWHSTEQISNTRYHQEKTIACAKKGIRLIHIFEYEWNDPIKRAKIEKYLKGILSNKNNNQIIYAKNTEIRLINNIETESFSNNYHLQGHTTSSINIGCFYEDELIGVMTFGKPRFNNNYEYELIRLCWKPDVSVVGGTEKMFKYFTTNYNPQSIITYTDISKFTGNVYTRLGFKPIEPNPITEPNYVWVSTDSNEILTRYQTMKHKLIEKGLGTEDQTESEIMENLGFLKIYDCGNIRLEYKI